MRLRRETAEHPFGTLKNIADPFPSQALVKAD
jgi:hypothetical protein